MTEHQVQQQPKQEEEETNENKNLFETNLSTTKLYTKEEKEIEEQNQ